MSDYDMDSDFDFEDEFDYNGDHFNSGFRAPRIPAQWRFLRDFIELVGGRYMPQTPRRLHSNDGSVRLDRDPSDWWINAQLENGALVSKYDQLADDRVARYRTVREATLLLGVLARVDYIAFLALLVRRGKFDVPKYMNLNTHALPRQFNFFFCRDLEAKEYAWARLQDVLGDRSYSQEFLEHLNTIDTMAHTTHEGEEESKTDDQRTASPMWHLLLVPLAVKLTFRPDETSVRNQVIILKNSTKIVREMQQIEETRLRSGHTDSSGRIVPPVFYLECIHLDLREFTLDPKGSLTLPFNVSADDEGSDDLLAVQLAWSSFVVVILGAHLQPPPRAPASRGYTMDLFMAPFLSALRNNTTVKSLRIEANSQADEIGASQERLWAGLGYALLSTSSSHTVESLDLSNHELSDEVLDAFARLATATNPKFEWLCSRTGQLNDNPSASVNYPVGAIKKGAPLPSSVHGEVIVVDAVEPEIILLVPGFGVVMVEKSHVRAAADGFRPRLTPPKRVTKLVFNAKPKREMRDAGQAANATRAFLPRLLEIIGAPLTSLGIYADDINDDCMQRILYACPRLDELLVDSAAVTSLIPLVNAYERGTGAQPLSINLRSVGVPVEAINDFLGRLGTVGYPLVATADALDAMLASNHRLSHLYVHVGRKLSWQPEEYEYNGEPIVGKEFPGASRFAFLSVLKYCSQEGEPSAAVGLSEDMLQLVFDYAGEASYRLVVYESSSRWRGFDWDYDSDN